MILTDKKGHLISNASFDELHEFAASIGLKREWYQNKRIPHYDLTTQHMKAKAIKHGACLVNSREIVRNALYE